MLVTTQQIAKLIDDYINKGYADRVLNREWRGQYIRGHAPWNNAEDCYHVWLKIVEDNYERLSKITDFDELYKELEKLAMKGIGDLTIYDTATMIGCPNGVYPQRVYLHAGAAIGAGALGISGTTVDKSVFVKICPDFDRLEPIQIEDFLCIYKSYLQGQPKASIWVCSSPDRASDEKFY